MDKISKLASFDSQIVSFYPFHKIRKDKKFQRPVQMHETFTQFPELVVLIEESL